MRMHAGSTRASPVKSGSILIGNLLSRNPPVCDTKSSLSSPYRYRWWRKNLILVLLATVCYITPKKINFMLRTIYLGIQEMLYLQDLHFNITTQQGCDSKITPMKRYICSSAQRSCGISLFTIKSNIQMGMLVTCLCAGPEGHHCGIITSLHKTA